MIRRTSKCLVFSAVIGFASYANAGASVVTPALAACSKALVETIAKSETLPAYKVKAPRQFDSSLADPNSFMVFARHGKTNALLAKASCKATSAGEIVSFKSIPLKS
jgi:hypothetical protein